jgi:site-specific recombinase XerD
MKARSQPSSRLELSSQYGTVRVYTRRHINGCKLPTPDHNHCSCPKWIYCKRRGGNAIQKSAGTPSFTEATDQAQKILKGFDPEIAAARKVNTPVLGPAIEEVLTRYLGVLASRKLSPSYLAEIPTYFQRRPDLGYERRRAPLNPSLLDFLDTINLTLADPITRMEQISSNLLDDWAVSWRANDLTCKQWRTIANGFFRWAVGRRYLDRMPVFGERQRVKKGNRCGCFTDDQYQKLVATLPFSLPNNVKPIANYAERLGAFLDLGRWAGMAVIDIVRFSPQANLDAHNVLTYSRAKNQQIAVVALDAAVAARLRSIPAEPGSLLEQPFCFPAMSEHTNGERWRNRFQSLCRKAGVPKVKTETGVMKNSHPHMLRDTFAIDAITRGVSLENVAKMMGHATIDMLQKAYLFWIAKRLDHCIEDQRLALARVPLTAPVEDRVIAPPRRTLVH